MYAQEIQPYLDNYYNTLEKSKIRDLIQHATNGGKCIRGFIVKHIIETLTDKKDTDISWQPIAGVELIHSASIVIDGKIVAAAQEERFTRVKHDSNYPHNAVEFVLNFATSGTSFSKKSDHSFFS